MAKRTRHQEYTKRIIAERFLKGGDPDELATEYNIAASTVKDYAKQFPLKKKVKRRVMVKEPKENTRVSELEKKVAELTIERDLWKTSYMAVITNQE